MLHGMAICAGGGGLEIALKLALGDSYKCVLYIEREVFAASTLVKHMEEGRLDKAPLWDDLKSFRGDVVSPFVGNIDILSGGIPCQPHSVAGQQRGSDDERDLWPDTARIIRDVKPAVVFLENVPGIMGYYHERIGGDLRGMGYSTETGLFSASEVGASHQRQRFFILAHREQSRITGRNLGGLGAPGRQTVQQPDQQNAPDKPSDRDTDVAHSEFQRRRGGSDPAPGREGHDRNDPLQTEGRCGDVAGGSAIPLFAPFRNDTDGWSRLLSEMPQAEPAFCGASYGSSNVFFLNEDRVDRLRSLGNMVVPLTGALAFATLSRRVKE